MTAQRVPLLEERFPLKNGNAQRQPMKGQLREGPPAQAVAATEAATSYRGDALTGGITQSDIAYDLRPKSSRAPAQYEESTAIRISDSVELKQRMLRATAKGVGL